MSQTWYGDTPPDPPAPISIWGWGRVLVRGGLLGVLVFGCLLILLAVRLIERPVFGVGRPITPHITCFVCRNAFRLLGMTFTTTGEPMRMAGAVVANHSSWLDIFALNARKRIYFVSKSEVAGWPGIGWLARATGTLFIERDPRKAHAQTTEMEERLKIGQKLLFFPEGTSTDGRRVLPFKTTLFQPFFAPGLRDIISVQPVSVIYRAPRGAPDRFYGWWGDMGFGESLLHVLAQAPQGGVEIVYHTPQTVSDFPDRKALAQASETAVRAGLDAALAADGRP